ncbi:hypothetical protein V8F33_000223, partial [Rhypophila sp. PSN 637]
MPGFTAINREPQYKPHPAWLSEQEENEIENGLIDGIADSETDYPYDDDYDDDDDLPKLNTEDKDSQLDNFDPRDWDKTVSEINSISSEELHETRPNRWKGNPSTWRKHTQADRDVWNTLERIRMGDLAVHLYNTHVLRRNARIKTEERKKKGKAKATPKGKGQASLKETDIPQSGQGGETEDDNEGFDENGDAWQPAKTWTAWPAFERGYERLGDGQIMADSARVHVEKEKLPGDNLREEIAAGVLRAVKERFYRRQAKRKRREEQGVEDDGNAMDVDESEASAARGRAEKERSPSPELFLRADDEVNFRVLRPVATDIMHKLDETLTLLHNSRIATMRLKLDGSEPTAEDDKKDDTKSVADTAAGDKTPKRSSPASKDSTPAENTTPMEVRESIETPVPLPKQTPVPLPKTPVPLPKTAVPLPKTPVPLPKTPGPLPKRTPVPLPGETEEQMRVRIARLQKKPLPESYWDSHDRPTPGSGKKSAARSRAGSTKATPKTEPRPTTPGGTTEPETEADTGTKTKKTPQKRLTSRASSVGSVSTNGDTPILGKHRIKLASKLALRNWRDVITAAGLAGFEPDVIARAAQRCATLFQGDISLSTMHEVPLTRSHRAGWESVTYKPGNLAAGREESDLESEEDEEEEEEVKQEEDMEVDGEEKEEDEEEEEEEDSVDKAHGAVLVDGYLRPLSFPDMSSGDEDEDETASEAEDLDQAVDKGVKKGAENAVAKKGVGVANKGAANKGAEEDEEFSSSSSSSDETASEAEDLDQDADKGVDKGAVKAVDKVVAKKGVANKGVANKGAVNKAVANKAVANNTVANKGAANKAPANKAPAKKAPAKKGPVKKTVAVEGFVAAAKMVKKSLPDADFSLVYSS